MQTSKCWVTKEVWKCKSQIPGAKSRSTIPHSNAELEIQDQGTSTASHSLPHSPQNCERYSPLDSSLLRTRDSFWLPSQPRPSFRRSRISRGPLLFIRNQEKPNRPTAFSRWDGAASEKCNKTVFLGLQGILIMRWMHHFWALNPF